MKKKKPQKFETESNTLTIADGDEISLNVKMVMLEEYACKQQKLIYKKIFHKKIAIEEQLKALKRANDRIVKYARELEINVPIIWRYIWGKDDFKNSWQDAISMQLDFMGKAIADTGRGSCDTVIPIYRIGIIPPALHQKRKGEKIWN